MWLAAYRAEVMPTLVYDGEKAGEQLMQAGPPIVTKKPG